MPDQSPKQSQKQDGRAPAIAGCGSGAEEARPTAPASAVGALIARRGAVLARGREFIER